MQPPTAAVTAAVATVRRRRADPLGDDGKRPGVSFRHDTLAKQWQNCVVVVVVVLVRDVVVLVIVDVEVVVAVVEVDLEVVTISGAAVVVEVAEVLDLAVSPSPPDSSSLPKIGRAHV